jgi:hypothetical protein
MWWQTAFPMKWKLYPRVKSGRTCVRFLYIAGSGAPEALLLPAQHRRVMKPVDDAQVPDET